MKILKIFNNNSVAALTETGQDIILTGSGIGFQKRVYDFVDEAKIERMYIFQENQKKRFEQTLSNVPTQYFEITEAIVKKASKCLHTGFSSEIFLSMADHISYAVKRKNEGIYVPNIILSETKTLYKKEYEIGLWALDYIQKWTGVQLDEDEAGNITLQLVNFSLSVTSNHAAEIVVLTKEILDLVQDILELELQSDSLQYSRIMTHLKYLGERIFSKEIGETKDTTSDIRNLFKNDVRMIQCIDCIIALIKEKYAYELTPDEQTYLCIHIRKIIPA